MPTIYEYNDGGKAMKCLVCDNPIELSEEEKELLSTGHVLDLRLCDECKEAILWAKQKMHEDEFKDIKSEIYRKFGW